MPGASSDDLEVIIEEGVAPGRPMPRATTVWKASIAVVAAAAIAGVVGWVIGHRSGETVLRPPNDGYIADTAIANPCELPLRVTIAGGISGVEWRGTLDIGVNTTGKIRSGLLEGAEVRITRPTGGSDVIDLGKWSEGQVAVIPASACR